MSEPPSPPSRRVIRYPADLPITARRDEIIAAIRSSQVVVLAGETGSGKTTQLPKMCMEVLGDDPRALIGCTQPRRVAAMSVSRRVAEELGVRWGGEVGCKMRFSDDTTRDTRIKFMTDGILLAETQGDPLLSRYRMIIVDEAHERSLNIDFLLGYLKQLLPRRPDLKVIITSATIDTKAFAAHFDQAPIIEVSGRVYPVEVRYAPHEDRSNDDLIDAAVEATKSALNESHAGDVLIFMPTERDIRDTADVLSGHIGGSVEVLPLFGRMSNQDQQRIFSPGSKRRVVVATNVAETSITIPRVRYVIDSGLARISRYNARTRTKRLPVEEVAQSSANQRAGRAGRVQDGVCIRLYDEENFKAREPFTMPEIQRANLAEVILRMKAFKLGDIETFPFIHPPSGAAIRGGYDLLEELGALSDTHELTSVGGELARLPLDPTLGRMLLQARKEKALPEMLIIAAGLSLPDPRERPEDERERANAAHKAFIAPESDFLTLLRIWQKSPIASKDAGTGALRKFCKANYISFMRLREWRDLWKQLSDEFEDDLKESGTGILPVTGPAGVPPAANAHDGQNARRTSDRLKTGPSPAASPIDDAIHRSILAGLLGHIAMREGRNAYKAAGNREVTLFPGSCMYERREKNAPTPKPGQPQEKSKQAPWIVAGEIVQTSQLFARSVAKIDPEWIIELGAHIIERKYSEPHYSSKAGRVLVTERCLLHGLEVKRHSIDFVKIDAKAATLLFIRAALIDCEAPLHLEFHRHNLALREKLETSLNYIRNARAWDIEEALVRFYEQRLERVSSVHDLNRLVKERSRTDANFLFAREADLLGSAADTIDLTQFPDRVELGNTVLPLNYSYDPGAEDDGVTVQVPEATMAHLTSAQVQWMVPGLRLSLIETLLRALPKALRRQFMPIEEHATIVVDGFEPGRGEFLDTLAEFLTQRFRIQVKGSDWPKGSVPQHLQPRVEMIDAQSKVIATSRDLEVLRSQARKVEHRSDAWDKAKQAHERHALRMWSFGDLPASVFIEEIAGAAVHGYPGLVFNEGAVDLLLHRKPEPVAQQSPAAVRWLAEQVIGKDIAWLMKELRSLRSDGAPTKSAATTLSGGLAALTLASTPAITASPIEDSAREHILAHLLRLEPVLPLTQARFTALCETARKELPLTAHRVREALRLHEELRRKLAAHPRRYATMQQDVDRLLPPDLLIATPHAMLTHLPRYLKAVELRADRAHNDPSKDATKQRLIDDFKDWRTYVLPTERETFRWMLEEYRVQVFAPELGTAMKVSPKRLEEMLGS